MTDELKAPERIWWNPEGHWSLHDDSAIRRSPSVEYVRADLVTPTLSDALELPEIKALVEALEEISAESSVNVYTCRSGINFKKMYEGWREIATSRIDLARAALAALPTKE